MYLLVTVWMVGKGVDFGIVEKSEVLCGLWQIAGALSGKSCLEQDLPRGVDWLSIRCGLENFLIDGFVFIGQGKQEVEGLRLEISFGQALRIFRNFSEGQAEKNQEIEMRGGIEGGFG